MMANAKDTIRGKAIMESLIISLKPSIQCNFKCNFCLSNSAPCVNQTVSSKELKRFFDVLSQVSFEGTIHISGGEPFLYKDLESLLEKCCKYASLTIILTNGSWIPSKPTNEEYSLFINKLKRIFQWHNAKIRISMDSAHLDKEMGDSLGLERLKIFEKASREIGLGAGKDFSIVVTEETIHQANKMKEVIFKIFDNSTINSDFIEVREILKLGRSKNGSQLPLRQPGFITVRPNENGNLNVYFWRKEESLNIPAGGVDVLARVIKEHRKMLNSEDNSNVCACILNKVPLMSLVGVRQ